MNAASSDRDPIDRLAEEFVARYRRGERPPLSEYVDRHPELAEEIRELFPTLVAMERYKPGTADVTGPYSDAEGTPLQRLGDYRILREIGRGGMGVVYEAEQVSLGRHVALKVLPSQALLDPKRLARFQREARSAARLHHTNIVPVYGVGEAEGLHFYVMQFIQGQGLDKVLDEVKRQRTGNGSGTTYSVLSTETTYCRAVARIGVQAANALDYAHGQGVLHRDVKPSNLLLDAQGTVWVTDFGLAKAADAEDLTNTGDIVGTLRYMAPERFEGKADARSDIYSLGLTLYELLTLRPAFDAPDRVGLIQQVTTATPVRPRRIDPTLPRDLETIVLKAIARDPAHRYQTGRELADDLQRFLDDRQVRARRATLAEQGWRWCRRNPVVASLTAVVAILLVAVAVVGFVSASRERASERAARRLVAAQYVQNGTRALEEGDYSGALVWFVEALEKDKDDPERAALHRVRITALLRTCPRPARAWFHDGDVFQAVFSPDGKRVASTSGKAVRVWDVQTGHLLGSPLEHPGFVHRLVWRRDGKIVTVSKVHDPRDSLAESMFLGERTDRNLEVRVWQPETGACTNLPLGDDRWHVVISPGGRYLVAGPYEHRPQVWDLSIARPLPLPTNSETRLVNAYFSPDGEKVFLILRPAQHRADEPIREGSQLLDLARRAEVPLEPSLGDKSLVSLEFSSDGERLLAMDGDGLTRVVDAETGRQLCRFRHTVREHREQRASFSPDGSLVVIAAAHRSDRAAGTERLFDALTGKPVATPFTSSQPVRFSPDGLRLLTADPDGQPLVQFLSARQKPVSPLRHERKVTHSEFSPDGRYVLTVSEDHAVRLWDAWASRLAGPIFKHEADVTQATFSPDGRFILTVCGGAVRLWPVAPTLSGGREFEHEDPLTHVLLSRRGDRVLSVSSPPPLDPLAWFTLEYEKGTARIWDVATGKELEPPLPLGHAPRSVRLSDDGRFAQFTLMGEVDPEANPRSGRRFRAWLSWDLETGRHVTGHIPRVKSTSRSADFNPSFESIHFSRDGRVVLTLSPSEKLAPNPSEGHHGEARLWDAATGEEIATLPHEGFLRSAAFSPESGRVLTVSRTEAEKVIQVWNVRGNPVSNPIRVEEPHELHAEFSDDGKRILGHAIDYTALRRGHAAHLHVWETATGRNLSRAIRLDLGSIPAGRGGAYTVPMAWNRDGSRLLTVRDEPGDGKAARVWDALTGDAATPWLAHEAGLTHLGFDPDGGRVVSACRDGTVYLHDAGTGEATAPAMRHLERVTWAGFSKDGRRLLTTSAGRDRDEIAPAHVRFWDTATGQPLTPPLRTVPTWSELEGGDPTSSPFSSDGDRVLLATDGRTFTVFDLAPEPRPVEELRSLARGLSGRRINDTGALQSLRAEEVQAAWRAIEDKGASTAISDDVRWDRGQLHEVWWPMLPSGDAWAALAHLDRLLAAAPGNRFHLANRAFANAMFRRWQRVLDDLDRLGKNESVMLQFMRVLAETELGRYADAERDIAELKKMPGADRLSREVGMLGPLLVLARGDAAGYRSACAQLVEQEGKGLGGDYAVWLCLVTEEGMPESEKIRPLVEQARDRRVNGWPVLAAFRYREGKYDEAVRMLEAKTSGDREATAADWFFLAMARCKKGEKEKAREALARGAALREEAEWEERLAAGNLWAVAGWEGRFALRRLHGEAEELIKR